MEPASDVVTLGDHIYRRSEINDVLKAEHKIVKPANYPPEAPGHEVAIATAKNGVQVAVISLMGRVFMRPVDCPFKAVDRVLAGLPQDIRVVVVDFHAEATSDKQLMGRISMAASRQCLARTPTCQRPMNASSPAAPHFSVMWA